MRSGESSSREHPVPPGDADPPSTPFAELDDSEITRFQYKVMLVSGMGFFCDAYDLFVIGVVVALLRDQWGLSTGQIALLNSVTLAASALGALGFGWIADVVGRKKVYGFEVIVLAIGAIASACSPNLTFLLAARIVLGVGIGGDYPVSATIMSEYSGRRTRGRMVGLVFTMQGAGLVTGPLLASILLASHVPHELTWRILLAFGAVPAMAVFYLRRQIHETPRFARATGDLNEARAAIAAATGKPGAITVSSAISSQRGARLRDLKVLVKNRRLLAWLIGTTTTWALLGFSYYGNTISSPAVLSAIDPTNSLLENILLQLAIFTVFALPGYWLAVRFLDRLGRKRIQSMGFFIMAIVFLSIGLIPRIAETAGPFVLLFGVTYLFSEFGPNTTTFVIPSEIFPVHVRATADGISAAAGKVGAFLGAFLFPVILASSLGLRGAEVICGVVCIVGLGLTSVLLPEPKGLALEQIERIAWSHPPS
jgi:MFS family permease